MNILQEYLERGAEQLGIVLEQAHVEKFKLFATELCKWNRKINLTAITRTEDIAVKHFLDSLAILKHVNISGELLDIGSGGGFPAIPLKIVTPAAIIVSLDAVDKKILFQRHVARLLCLENFTALHARVEDLGEEYPERFNRVVSRAFSDIPKYVQLALPLLAPDGVIIAMKGREGKSEAEMSSGKLTVLGAVVADIHEFRLPFSGESRSLVIIRRDHR
ncbi:MAG: gidB [Deltaproteobacteria bacterium]|nr:gidB [Deltaproteobacteria bacterium]